LDADLPLVVDVLGDLITSSVLVEADVETERAVILEEIAMHDDEPDDEVHDLLAQAIYGDDPLGRLVSGTAQTVGALSREQILGFYRRWYTPPNMVVTAAGHLDHDQLVELDGATPPVAGPAADPAPLV